MSENCLSRTSSRVSERQNVTMVENNRISTTNPNQINNKDKERKKERKVDQRA